MRQSYFIFIFLLHLLLVAAMLLGVKKDKEFQIETTKHDIFYFIVCELITFYLLFAYRANVYAEIFLGVALAILIVSAYTDKKTMLVYMLPAYVMLSLGVILECIATKGCSFYIMIIFALPIFLGLINAFGRGDIPMCMVFGGGIYFCTFRVIESLFWFCLMIMLTEILFFIKAIKEKNLKNPFCLKEKRPLGPCILVSTFVLFILHSCFI